VCFYISSQKCGRCLDQRINIKFRVKLSLRIREAVRRKRRGIWPNCWILHHDSAPAHKAHYVKQFLAHPVPVIWLRPSPCTLALTKSCLFMRIPCVTSLPHVSSVWLKIGSPRQFGHENKSRKFFSFPQPFQDTTRVSTTGSGRRFISKLSISLTVPLLHDHIDNTFMSVVNLLLF
jgi:hypothetical protein